MDASTMVAIEANKKGEKVGNDWQKSWSNLTDAERAAGSATQGAGSGSGSGGGINWGNVGSTAQQLFSGWRQSKGTGVYSQPTSYDPPKKDNTATYIVVGVGAIALIGVAVWYFGFKKK
jgi:hypothetical protein